MSKFVAPHIAAVTGYHPIAAAPAAPDVLKMDLNESTAPPSPRVIAALARQAALNWYPEPTCATLCASLGRYLDVPADHLLVTNGSNQAMELIARAFLSRDDEVLIVSPVYTVFKIQCQLQQARITEFFFQDAFAPAFDELLKQPGNSKAIFLANPNNPTGVGLRREQIEALLKQFPETLIILDEAYAEFHDAACAGLRSPNLMVLRSFSKAFALAGLRCGYVVAQPALLTPLTQVFAPWSVNALTQVGAQAALEDLPYMRALVAECHAAKQLLVEGLTRLGFIARNTAANFILWQVRDPAKVVAQLAERHLYVSNKDAVPQLKGYLRVTAGTRAEAERVLEIVAGLER